MTGNDNIAIGVGSLATTEATHNSIGIGRSALNLSTGGENVALGYNAGVAVTTGTTNTMIGNLAGNAITTGSDNISIGNVGVAAESGIIRIGTTSTHTATHLTGTVYTADGTVQTSSIRYKKDVEPLDSSDALKLRPVRFKFKDGHGDSGRIAQYGLIAEEVAEVNPELVQFNPEGNPEGIRTHMLIPVMLSTIQELQARIKKLELL